MARRSKMRLKSHRTPRHAESQPAAERGKEDLNGSAHVTTESAVKTNLPDKPERIAKDRAVSLQCLEKDTLKRVHAEEITTYSWTLVVKKKKSSKSTSLHYDAMPESQDRMTLDRVSKLSSVLSALFHTARFVLDYLAGRL